MKQIIKTFYNNGIYTKENVLLFLKVKMITEEEYIEIIEDNVKNIA